MYGVDAVISIEIKELAWRKANPLPEETNGINLREDIDFLEERRLSYVLIRSIVQQTTITKYNRHVRYKEFQ